jgi:hypothetical protein
VRRLLTFIALALLGTWSAITVLIVYPEAATLLTMPGMFLMVFTPLTFLPAALLGLAVSGSTLAAVAMALNELHRRRTGVPT